MRPIEIYERPHCRCCGKVITWSATEAERSGYRLQFCGIRCVEVFDTYKYPTYGDVVFVGLEHVEKEREDR
jgi:hypothetical protein